MTKTLTVEGTQRAILSEFIRKHLGHEITHKLTFLEQCPWLRANFYLLRTLSRNKSDVLFPSKVQARFPASMRMRTIISYVGVSIGPSLVGGGERGGGEMQWFESDKTT